MTHEVGHLSGLDHTCIGPATMYCYYGFSGGFFSRALEQDDPIGISTLYPEPTFLSSTGEISGTVTRSGGQPVFGAHVVAIDAATGIVVASAIAGLVATLPNGMPLRFSQPSGDYLLTGLPPGSYTILAEPLDGPPVKSPLGGIFGNYSDQILIETNFTPGFSAILVAVRPGVITSGVGVIVGARSSLSPNLDEFSFASVSGQPFRDPAMAFPGTSPTLSIGYGENIVSGGALVPGTVFQFSGGGINMGGIVVRSTDILIPITISPLAVVGPRLLIVTTPDGISTFAGALTIVSSDTVADDFDGDGKSDIGVYRDGIWFVRQSSNGAIIAKSLGGAANDKPVAADYDSDGQADPAVYRDGIWFIRQSSNGAIIAQILGGAPTDVPVPAEYDGDGRADQAVYRDGIWFIRQSSNGAVIALILGGAPQDIPLN
jgi:Matrixin